MCGRMISFGMMFRFLLRSFVLFLFWGGLLWNSIICLDMVMVFVDYVKMGRGWGSEVSRWLNWNRCRWLSSDVIWLFVISSLK